MYATEHEMCVRCGGEIEPGNLVVPHGHPQMLDTEGLEHEACDDPYLDLETGEELA